MGKLDDVIRAYLRDRTGSRSTTVDNLIRGYVLVNANELVAQLAAARIEPLMIRAQRLAGLIDGVPPDIWIVTEWLCEHLAARGQRVDYDFAGFDVWARRSDIPLHQDPALKAVAGMVDAIPAS